MKKADVRIGAEYSCKVSGRLQTVRIMGVSPYGGGGWDAVNPRTGRAIHIRSAVRLRRLVAEVPNAP